MFTGERDMTQHDTTSMAPCGREPTQKVAEQGRDSKSSNWLFQGTGSYQNFRTCARRGVQAEQQQRRATGATATARLVQVRAATARRPSSSSDERRAQPTACASCSSYPSNRIGTSHLPPHCAAQSTALQPKPE